ncbi:MAG: 2-octaprenyl-6-methoxyphenyl hydroxylase, partial [Alphaproteobacteria bacterium]|nr:2-octaprenyl-6-methoxyphenyl hydroxylase [Alphaproteobacteria bacterium]
MRNKSTPTGAGKDADILDAEVLIIGGGLVGGTLATAFGQAGLDVAVVDTADPVANLDAGFDGRACAIALATQRVLAGVGLWTALRPQAAPILDIRVSEGSSPFFLHYDHNETGDEAFGYMVENRNLRKALFHRLQELKTVHVCAPASVVTLDRQTGGVTATLADGRCVRA